MRDEFNKKTIDLLANRVGWKCSNPSCRRTTRGAGTEALEIVNIGVAAHITAASKRGPRYDCDMTSQERKSYENGIWLCQACAKLIDSDVKRYTIDKIRKWKEISEEIAVLEIEEGTNNKFGTDKEKITFFLQCFDRPAFRDLISQEGRMEDFDKAIEDTIVALNTGVLRDRDGNILRTSEGKSTISRKEWREKLDVIGDMLTVLRKRLKIAKASGAYSTYGDYEVMYYFHDRELGAWFDSTREEILKILSSICEDIGMERIHFPRDSYRW